MSDIYGMWSEMKETCISWAVRQIPIVNKNDTASLRWNRVYLISYLWTNFDLKKIYFVVLILFHVDVTFNIRYIYRENIFINENNCISSTSFCPPRPLLPSLPKAQQISNELAGLHTLRCWQAAKLLKQHLWWASSTSRHATRHDNVMKSCCMTAM